MSANWLSARHRSISRAAMLWTNYGRCIKTTLPMRKPNAKGNCGPKNTTGTAIPLARLARRHADGTHTRTGIAASRGMASGARRARSRAQSLDRRSDGSGVHAGAGVMADTANRTWTSRDLDAHIRQEQAAKERAKDWLLACTSAEFAFRLAEQGHNLDYV